MTTDSGDVTDNAAEEEVPRQAPESHSRGMAAAGGGVGALEESRAAGMDAIGAALAHELNQPLTALMLYLESLKRLGKGSASPEVSGMVDKALNEAERAIDIVRRMRRLSLRPEPDRRPVDLNALCREVIDLALMGVGRRPRLRTSFAPDLPEISADPVQLRQVIVNLIRNAAEAAGESRSPSVFVSTAVHENAVQVTVADNGPGVPTKIADRLFRAFETSKTNGQGLGLAISRMIAQNHGGDVVMKSTAGELGAVFALILPLR